MTTMHKTMNRWLAAGAALAAAALLLAACGGGADRTKAQVRLVNASGGYPSLDLRVDDSVRQSGVTYGTTDSYVEIDPGKADTVLSRNGSSTALLSFTPTLDKNKHYSLLAYGAQGALKQLLLDENASQPDTNRTLLRIVNAAPDAGGLDVYLTGDEDLLTTSVPVQSGASFGALNGFLTQISGSYRLRITATGSKTDVRLNLPSITLSSKQITTLVLTPGRGGVLLNALLVNQESAINRLDNTQARMRVAAGVTDAATVRAVVGSTTLLNNNAPVIGAYQLTPAGTPTMSITVNGATVVAPTTTLGAGSDYTLLVYGPSAAPLARLIPDDNRLPSDPTQARLRLVNGVAETAPLSMTVNLEPVFTGTVPNGEGSAYADVVPTTTARIGVTTSGQSTAVFSAIDQIFTAGSTYTVFVLGPQAAATGTLRKDR